MNSIKKFNYSMFWFVLNDLELTETSTFIIKSLKDVHKLQTS